MDPITAVFLGMNLMVNEVDWRQTRKIADDPIHYSENNSAMGPHPDAATVNRFFIQKAAISVAAAEFLPPPLADGILAIDFGLEVSLVRRNASIHLGISF